MQVLKFSVALTNSQGEMNTTNKNFLPITKI